MTIEELLKPRYKVIADYPFNPYPVGDVIDLNSTMKNFLVAETGQYAHFIPISEMDKMPHLFKKLEWWEERKPEEMPEYIKSNDNRAFRPMSEITPTGFRICCIEKWLPATREEYEAQNQPQ